MLPMRSYGQAWLVAVVSLVLIVGSASAQELQRTINVAGTGTASAPPDLATINTGVVTTAKTAKEALTENTKLFEQVLQVLEDNGIDSKDVQTTFFNVNPQFERDPQGVSNKVIGYRVSNEVQVKVRDFDNLGAVLDALVRAGSNRISGVRLSIADPKAITNEARKLAVADAKSRAETYAEAAGVKVGKILSISETTIQQPKAGREFALSADAADVPIAGGELSIETTVFILFELLA